MAKYTVTYQGKIPSLNSWYSSSHWYSRANAKKEFSKIFTKMLTDIKMPFIDKFKISISFNSRHDVDNVITIPKMLVDTMKGKWIAEDGKKYYRGYSVEPNESLPKDTFVIDIIEL